MRSACIAALALGMLCFPATAQVSDWLPDMTVNPTYLEDTAVVDNVAPGRIHLRLSNATPNIGLGPMHVYGVLPANPDGSQDVVQRIFRSDGSHFDRPAGRFVFHPEHDHIHVEDWAVYRLRAVLPGGGVGEVVAQGEKTSYCLRDSKAYDPSLPNFPDAAEYVECDGTTQGISVGYEDIYTKELPDQWIDVTDVPQGEYWLESEVDPGGHVLEADETNNIVRVRVTVGEPQGRLAQLLDFVRLVIQQLLAWIRSLFGLPGDKAACDCGLPV